MQGLEIYKASLQDKNQFVVNEFLNMRLVLEKFVQHFTALYGNNRKAFMEEEGRKYFSLYLKPIINGTGNCYFDDYNKNKGYMISFNFTRNKQVGVSEIVVEDKVIVEAVV